MSHFVGIADLSFYFLVRFGNINNFSKVFSSCLLLFGSMVFPLYFPLSLPLRNAIDFMNMLFVICWIILFPLHFNHHDDNICWQQYTDVFSDILRFVNSYYIDMRK